MSFEYELPDGTVFESERELSPQEIQKTIQHLGVATSSSEGFLPIKPEFDEPADTDSASSVVDRMGTTSQRQLIQSQLGVQPEQVEWDKDAPASLGRGWAGFMDNDADMTKAFRSRAYPQAEIKTVGKDRFIKLHPDMPWRPFDKAGLSLGDVSDFASDVPEVVASVAKYARGGSVPGAALWAALAQSGEEGVKAGTGYTPDLLGPVKVGAGELAGGYGAGLLSKPIASASNWLTGRRPSHVAPETVQTHKQIMETYPDAPHLMPHQLSDSKIIERQAAQARYTSGEGIIPQEKAQQAWSLDQLNQMGPTRTRAQVLEAQKQAARDATSQMEREATQGVVQRTPQSAGTAMQKGVETDIAVKGRVVNRAYNEVDDAALKEQPIFSLENVQAEARSIREGVQGLSTTTKEGTKDVPGAYGEVKTVTTSEPVTEGLEVSGVPQGELDRVVNDILTLDPGQVNHEVVKNLRTRLYDLVDNPAYAWDPNKYKALQLYKKLSDTLQNPLNKAPTYKAAIGRASGLARDRFQLMEHSNIRKVLDTDNHYTIGEMIQIGQLTPTTVGSIRKGGQIDSLKQGLNWQIINSSNPRKTLLTWQKNHPEVFSRIYGKSEIAQMTKVANQIDALRGQKLSQMAETMSRSAKDVSDAAQYYDPAGTANLAKRMDVGQRQSFKEGIYMDFLNKTVRTNEKGVRYVDAQSFADLYKQYKDAGFLDSFLSATDRKRLQTLGDYVSLSNGTLKDVGAALEGAQLISQLKDIHSPPSMVKGYVGLNINSMLAKFIASPKGNKVMLGWSDKTPFSNRSMQGIGLFLGALAEE